MLIPRRGEAPPVNTPFARNLGSLQSSGLIGWWSPLAFAGVRNPPDLTGLGPDGSMSGLGLVPHPILGAVWRTGTVGNFLNSQNSTRFNFTYTTPFTWMGWVLQATTARQIIAGNTTAVTGGEPSYPSWWIDLGQAGVGAWSLTTIAGAGSSNLIRETATAAISTTTTNLLTVTFAGDATLAAIRLYANGREITSTGPNQNDNVTNANSMASGAPFVIGSGGTVLAVVRPPVGTLFGENRIYNRVLTPAEVWHLYDPATRWELYDFVQRYWFGESVASSDLSISVSDSVGVAESVGREVTSFITKSETVTLTESIQREVVSFIAQSEAVTVAESVAGLVTSFVEKSDSVTLAESVTLSLESSITVSDQVNLTEALTFQFSDPQVAVNDSVSVAEVRQLTQVLLVAVSESVQVSDSYDRWYEQITVSESVALAVSVGLAVSDSILVSEIIVVVIPITGEIPANDVILVSELVSLTVSAPQISVSDSVLVAEAVAGVRSYSLSVSDSVQVSDSYDRWYEQVAVSELVSLVVPITIAKSEAVGVAENRSVLVSTPQITVSEQVALAEALALLVQSFVSRSEAITVNENTTVTIQQATPLLVAVNDPVGVAEDSLVALDDLVAIATDPVMVNEAVSLAVISFVTTLFVTVGDSVGVTDQPQVEQSFSIRVAESVLVTPVLKRELVSFIGVGDALTVIDAHLLQFGPNQITVNEGVFISESSALFTLSVPPVAVAELISTSELVLLALISLASAAGRVYTVDEGSRVAVVKKQNRVVVVNEQPRVVSVE